MSLEYIVEELGYDMHDNIIKRCREQLDKVVSKPRKYDEYLIRIKRIINRAS
jgi:hypothetical protein